MTDVEIYAVLEEIFRDILMRDDIVLTPELTAADVEGLSSFKMIEIILATEEKFSISLTTRDVDSIRNVGDIAKIISKKI